MPVIATSPGVPRLDLGQAFKEYIFDADAYVASKVFAPFTVSTRTGQLPKIQRDYLLRRANVKRGPAAAVTRSDIGSEYQTFTLIDRSHETLVDDQQRAEYKTQFDVDSNAAENSIVKIMNDMEIDLFTDLFNTTTFTGSSLYLDTATVWSNTAADVIGDVNTAKAYVQSNTGLTPNAIVMNSAVAALLYNNDDLVNRVQYVQLATQDVISSTLAALFGVEYVFISKAVYNSANIGAAAVITRCASSSYVQVCCVATPGSPLYQPCIGRTLMMEGDGGGAFGITQYRDEQRVSDVFRARMFSQALLIDPSYGFLLKID